MSDQHEWSRAKRAFQSLFNWAAVTGPEPTGQDLAIIPEEYREAALEEVAELRKIYRSGDRAGARQGAHAAALRYANVFGRDAGEQRGDPRALARAVYGEEAAGPDTPPLSGGSDPTGPTESTDPRALADRIYGVGR